MCIRDRVQVAPGRLHPGLPQSPSWGIGNTPRTAVATTAVTNPQRSQCTRLSGLAGGDGGSSTRGGVVRAPSGGAASAAVSGAPHCGQLPSVRGNHVQHLVQTLSATASPRMAPAGREHVGHHRFITGSSRAGALTGRTVNGAVRSPPGPSAPDRDVYKRQYPDFAIALVDELERGNAIRRRITVAY